VKRVVVKHGADGKEVWFEGVRVGDEIVITHPQSVAHFSGPRASDAMPIDGEVIEVDSCHYLGQHLRPFRVRFTDGRTGWWAKREFRVTRKGARP